MSYTLAPYDSRQYFDDNGDPLAFGKVNTYLSGTTTPVFTFADSTGTLNTNPVVLSASGRARIYLDPLLSYKFIVTDANSVPVGLTMDPVSLNQATLQANVFQASTRGTVALPAFSFVADPDTGIFSSAANTLDFATSGAQRVRIYPTGGVSVGNTTDPGAGIISATTVEVANGTQALPSFSFASHTDAGFYYSGGGAGFGAMGIILDGNNIVSISRAAQSVSVNSRAMGTGSVPGAQVGIGCNSSGGGAAGILALSAKNGSVSYVWADASSSPGQLRISTGAPEEDGTPSDTSGTVVGTQTSSRDTKDVLGDGVAPADALVIILHTPVSRFTYKGGSYSGTVFHGIIADDSPEFAMDPDEAHPFGRSFNPVSAFGYTVQAFKALEARIIALEAALRSK